MLIRFALVASVVLLGTAAYARDTGPALVTPGGEKVICQKVAATGSLVKTTKRCYTRAQWDRIADAARVNGQRITDNHAAGLELSN